ncbi:MAG TPA: hypothetical protein VD815_03330 [Candidatus Saccharimonadales bacterium]|nr:hypothetical protein [Candidatus Saccharimonadales bacterium]
MKKTIVIGISFIMAIFSIVGIISLNVTAKEKPLEPNYTCDVISGGYLRCCQAFITDDGTLKDYCTTCDNTKPPSNCTPRMENNPRVETGEDIATPPTEGISDDPKAGDDPNPGIPSTGGVSDDPQTGNDEDPSIPPTGGIVDENDNNSGSDNESPDTPNNTIPRKGGSSLDTSNLNENVIVQ